LSRNVPGVRYLGLATGRIPFVSWAERAADQSPTVRRSRARSIEQSMHLVSAARRLIEEHGDQWTTQDLAREAGVALQTFYRSFGSKDQLLLAVIEDLLTQSAADYERAGSGIADPLKRLRSYVMGVFATMTPEGRAGSRFIIGQHWRLHQLYPQELAQAVRPITDLFAGGIIAAQEAGSLPRADPALAAQFVTRLVMVEYHYHAFIDADGSPAEIGERVWDFCMSGLSGMTPPRPAKRPRRRT
jgi:AcrR family transcriptional regulator